MADWDFLDEVDILDKLPPNFEELRVSKKWQERKEALDAFINLAEANPRLSTKTNYGEIVGNLQNMLVKETMVAVSGLVAKCITKLAVGLRTKFATFSPALFAIAIEKCKEKKAQLREPIIECMDALAATLSSIELLCDDIAEGMGKPNPQIKQQLDLFIYRQMNMLPADKAPKKLIKTVVPLLAKHCAEADADVREASFQAAGSIIRLIGEKGGRSLLGDIANDTAKMGKILEASTKAASEFAAHQAKTAAAAPSGSAVPSASAQSGEASDAVTTSAAAPVPIKEIDPFEMMEAVDVLAKLPADFETNMESKKWQERKEALETLVNLINKDPKLDPKANYGTHVGLLKKVLEKDANINVAAMAAKALTGIANGLRSKFASHAQSIVPVILDKFKEKKAQMRDPLIECIDAVTSSLSLEAIQDDLLAAMAKPNPNIKIQTDLYLYRAFLKLNSTTMPKKALKILAPVLIKHTGDSDPEVREASYAALGSAMRAIGEKPFQPLLSDIASDALKMGKIKEFYAKALEEAGPDVVQQMVQSIHKADEPAAAAAKKAAPPAAAAKKTSRPATPSEETEDESLKPGPGAAPAKKVEKKPVAAVKQEEPEEEPQKMPDECIAVNNDKAQRIKDERAHKLLKWNFTTPTEEHVAQLQQQIGTYAKVNLMTALFHKDFKQHVVACDLLAKAGDNMPETLVKNSDLLLKWCTLRFLETNPQALIKVLELSKKIVQLQREADEPLSSEEVQAFVPFLLLKTSETKENMRSTAREIIDEITEICGPFKMTPFIIDALKSKNARQRCECLGVLDSYIVRGGTAPLQALGIEKAIAACVGDRDQTVRNAAINALVACFRCDGDKMWRNAGKMADKDKALVEERIKRSGAVGGSVQVKAEAGTPSRAKVVIPDGANRTVVRRPGPRSRDPSASRADSALEDLNSTIQYTNRTPPRSRSHYQIDDDYVEMTGVHSLPSGTTVDMLLGYVPPKMPLYSQGPATTPTALRRTGSSSSISSIDSMDHLEKVIQNTSSALPDVAKEAIEQLTFMLSVEDQQMMLDEKASILMRAVATQLNLIRLQYGLQSDTGKQLILLIVNFFTQMIMNRDTALNMTDQSMTEWLYAMISILDVMHDDQMKRSLNLAVIRAFNRVEATVFFVGSIRSMTIALGEDKDKPSGRVQLFGKCLFKWQTNMEKQPVPIRLGVFLQSMNDLLSKFELDESSQSESIRAAHRAVDICIERALIISGQAVMDRLNKMQDVSPRLMSYVRCAFNTLNAIDGWQPLLSEVAEDLPEPRADSSRGSMSSRGGHVQALMTNIYDDPLNMTKHIQLLCEHLESNVHDYPFYEEYLRTRAFGDMITELVEEFKSTGKLRATLPQNLCDAFSRSQRMKTLSEQLMSSAPNSNGNTHRNYNVLQTRDINSESMCSDITVPANLTRPATTNAPVKKPKRTTLDQSTIKEMQARLHKIDSSAV